MSATTALLMVDMQTMYLAENQPRRDAFGWPPISRFQAVVKECQSLMSAARHGGIPVIYTRAGGRPDRADAMPSMRRLLASLPHGDPPSPAPSPILDAVAPQPGDVVLDKLRRDAFHFTELEPILRNLGVRRLMVAGLQIDVCVESTARSAMMRNFEVAVPEDAVSTDGDVRS